MRQTQALPTLLAAAALAVALAALFSGHTMPAAANNLVAQIEPAADLGGGFTYQGSLSRAGQLVDGADACDMRFTLWNAASGGARLGAAQAVAGVDFTQGLFTLSLNEAGQFGPAAFDGQARWLQVEAACPQGGAFTSLGRQAISAVPYATHSGSTAALRGRPVSAGAPSAGQVLGWNGSAWGPTVLQSGRELQGRPVSASAPNAGQVLAWDGSAWSPAADMRGVQYQRTVIVSPAASPAASGAALIDALGAIADATAENPYLLKIEPGVYDIGNASLQMKPYVDIEGSGQGVTTIVGRRRESFGMGVIHTADNVALRHLTVTATSGEGFIGMAVLIDNTSPHILHVTARADGANSYSFYVMNGGSPRMEHVTAHSTGDGFSTGIGSSTNATPIIIDSTIRAVGSGANYGVYAHGPISNTEGSRPVILGGLIEVSGTYFGTYGVISLSGSLASVHGTRIVSSVTGVYGFAGGTVRVGASQIDAPTPGRVNGGTVICAGAYNSAFAPLNGSCS